MKIQNPYFFLMDGESSGKQYASSPFPRLGDNNHFNKVLFRNTSFKLTDLVIGINHIFLYYKNTS